VEPTEEIMTKPDEVVQDTVAEQAASVAPDTSSLDSAGEDLAAAGARPAEVDTAALLAQLQALQAKVEAAIPEPAPPPPPARTTSQINSNAPGWMVKVLGELEDRIEALEGHRGD
jgi:hypothetical protein